MVISADVQAKWGAMASQGEIYSAWPFCMADEGVISQQGPPRMSPSGLESDCFLSRVLTKLLFEERRVFSCVLYGVICGGYRRQRPGIDKEVWPYTICHRFANSSVPSLLLCHISSY